ncbi:hypothetical protein GCM10028862_09440 [Luteimonas pelagia]
MRHPAAVRPLLALALAAALSSGCATTAATDAAAGPGTTATAEGRITSIDRDPWAYDGNAVMAVQTTGGTARVEIPARLNLCDAPGLDAFGTLVVGERIRATGEVGADGAITVCRGTGHALVRLD